MNRLHLHHCQIPHLPSLNLKSRNRRVTMAEIDLRYFGVGSVWYLQARSLILPHPPHIQVFGASLHLLLLQFADFVGIKFSPDQNRLP